MLYTGDATKPTIHGMYTSRTTAHEHAVKMRAHVRSVLLDVEGWMPRGNDSNQNVPFTARKSQALTEQFSAIRKNPMAHKKEIGGAAAATALALGGAYALSRRGKKSKQMAVDTNGDGVPDAVVDVGEGSGVVPDAGDDSGAVQQEEVLPTEPLEQGNSMGGNVFFMTYVYVVRDAETTILGVFSSVERVKNAKWLNNPKATKLVTLDTYPAENAESVYE